jgi:2-oxo-3-hexenedioate decarboxylase
MREAQDGAKQIEPFTDRYDGFDVRSAYAVARLIHDSRCRSGAIAVGRKIGFTNPDMWSIYGVKEPIWAHVYAGTVVHAEGGKALCSLQGLTEPKIEPEIIFHFRSAPKAGTGLGEILDTIDWVAHGFEIVQSHFPGWTFQVADTIADGGLHGRLLVGETCPVANLGPDLASVLQSFTVTLSRSGMAKETGIGSNVLGNPLKAIAHLLTVLRKQPMSPPLRAGEIVTTGTITRAQTIQPGEVWAATLHGIALPGLTVAFD